MPLLQDRMFPEIVNETMEFNSEAWRDSEQLETGTANMMTDTQEIIEFIVDYPAIDSGQIADPVD